MRYLLLSIFVTGFFFTENVSAQEYDNMPVFIQQKMDENKVNGENIYNGIEAKFHVVIANLSNEDVSALIAELQNDNKIKSVEFENNGNILSLITDGNYSIKNVKAHVVNYSASIENYSVNYEISQ